MYASAYVISCVSFLYCIGTKITLVGQFYVHCEVRPDYSCSSMKNEDDDVPVVVTKTTVSAVKTISV